MDDEQDIVCGWPRERWIAQDPRRAYRASRIVTSWIWSYLFRLRCVGAENVPESGPFLMVPNHSSNWDQYFQGAGQRRLVRFMCKESMFAVPIIGRYLRWIGAFPVRRGASDSFALDIARGVLASGEAVVIYPEGTRIRRTEALGTPRRGAARLALETGVPVVPVATYGAKPARVLGKHGWTLPKVTTVYGRPMSFAGREATPEVAAEVRDEIWAEVERLYCVAREIHRHRHRRRIAVTA